MKRLALGLLACLSILPAHAEEVLRLGKSAPTVFSYTLAELGTQQGIFARHGIRLEITAFGSSTQLVQAMIAGVLDVALDTGPDMAMVAKGAPMKAIAPLAGPPDELVIVVRTDGPIKTVADLKGRHVTVSGMQTMTAWLARELARSQGWGPDGVVLQPVPSPVTAVALLRAGQIDAITVDLTSGLRVEQEGFGHILLNHGERVRDFIIQAIYASDKLIADKPEAVRGFLAAWFETVAWAAAHKPETVAMAQSVLGVDPKLLNPIYDALAPNWSRDGRFDPAALEVLRHSFVDLGMLPEAPDMAKLTDIRFLPGK